MGVKKQNWGYGFAKGCGRLWLKSVWVEKMLKGVEDKSRKGGGWK